MTTAIGIAVAGGLGALARYGVDGAFGRRLGHGFPWATFVVNLSGAFLAGLLFTLLAERFESPLWVRQVLATGFLGGYTTFSAFGLETQRLLENGATGLALGYALGTLVAGLAACAGGVVLARLA